MRHENKCHIIPFYSKECKKIKMEHCNLEENIAIIRGVKCIKKEVSPSVKIFCNGKIIEDSIHYWVPQNAKDSTFERGIKLTEKGLGFSNLSKKTSILNFFKSK